jgi:hypothetical protein
LPSPIQQVISNSPINTAQLPSEFEAKTPSKEGLWPVSPVSTQVSLLQIQQEQNQQISIPQKKTKYLDVSPEKLTRSFCW